MKRAILCLLILIVPSPALAQVDPIVELQQQVALIALQLGALKSRVETLEGENVDLRALAKAAQSEVAEVASKLRSVSVSQDGRDIFVEGANLHVRNGEGNTSISNGLGNLVVGYDESIARYPFYVATGEGVALAGASRKNGSHNVVIGDGHSYTSYAGLVAGQNHRITAPYASVTGGDANIATEVHASVSGGQHNLASGAAASVSGGLRNRAEGPRASVTGGSGNSASGVNASVGGGSGNDAEGDHGVVVAGLSNRVEGDHGAVLGGAFNFVEARFAGIVGGFLNNATGEAAVVLSGTQNSSQGTGSVVLSGIRNVASGDHAAILPELERLATQVETLNAGGQDHTADWESTQILEILQGETDFELLLP